MALESRLKQVFSLTDAAGAREAYDDWAEDYDRDMLDASEEYVAPEIACKYLVRHLNEDRIAKAKILDAGCGTGLVGVQLSKAGAKEIDGIDLSEGMLRVASRLGIYGALEVADMSQHLSLASNLYDAVICVGTMTQGHVGPEAFGELVRVVKQGGYIVSTIRATIWETKGYKKAIGALCDEQKTRLLSAEPEEVSRGKGPQIILAVLQVI